MMVMDSGERNRVAVTVGDEELGFVMFVAGAEFEVEAAGIFCR